MAKSAKALSTPNKADMQPAEKCGMRAILEKDPDNPFKAMGGSTNHMFNATILSETMATVFVPGNEPNGHCNRASAIGQALAAFKPIDEIEGMLAAQAVAMHFGAMECFRRSMLLEQPAEQVTKCRRDGANLARGMADMLDALDRKRGKGPQVVRVERVVVQEGGQAIVGNVQAGATPAASGVREPQGPTSVAPAADVPVPGRGV